MTYNAEEEIKRTLDSIESQIYSDYEYVLVDGKSTDKTLELVSAFYQKMHQKSIGVHIISEEDNGIYNAMNKALKYVKGKYYIFLNAGDYFADNRVLYNVKTRLQTIQCDILYGDVILKRENYYKYETARNIQSIKKDMPFCHQSVFVAEKVFRNLSYDEKYKICADYDLFIRAYSEGYIFAYINIAISVYLMGGYSANNGSYVYWMERAKISYLYGECSEKEYIDRISQVEKKYRHEKKLNILKKCIPDCIISLGRKILLKKGGWEEKNM
ncbi:glycosyltransferase [Kineothrix sp. MSJ-39]|uniref:glycosyltransferase family 2 protein n=1 Tax=Kineothrix sp. MSJ-39 TaxID=2841533 RepID=UPI001C11EB43|nr:glycosyltransferase [Kineothrix sp. MSJ-39]